MPYPELMVAPMRQDLVRLGFRELRTPDEVDEALAATGHTVLMAVNSVCGCAAGAMRPAVAMALQGSGALPDVLATVFAGQDLDATDRAREYIAGYPPSSPSVALFRDGDLLYMMERHEIQGRSPQEIARNLRDAFDRYCS